MLKVKLSLKNKTQFHSNMAETRKYIPPYASHSFDERWSEEDRLWEMSLKESKRQKKERLDKLNDRQKKISSKVLPYEDDSKTDSPSTKIRVSTKDNA